MASTSCFRHYAATLSGFIVSITFTFPVQAADPAPMFFRGLNLNGPPVTIDGNEWEGRESKRYVCNDVTFEEGGNGVRNRFNAVSTTNGS